MSVTFEALWPLALLPLLAVPWLLRRRTLIEFAPRQLDAMLLLRGIALVAAVGALMQPVLHRSGSWLAVAWALDVSRSVAPGGLDEAIDWIDDARSAGRADASAFVAFGANATGVDDAAALRSVPVADGPVPGALDRSGTSLEAALERAMASLPPHHVPRIVLLSDGNGNVGDLGRAVDHLRSAGVRVHVRPLGARHEGDAWIEDVTLPDTVTAGAPFRVRARARTQVAREGFVEVRAGDEVLLRDPLRLEPGATALDLEVAVEEPGPAVLEVALRLAGDPLPDNDAVRVPALVRPRPRILHVEGLAGTEGYLRDALEDAGFEVVPGEPGRLPADPAALEAFDAVILSDVDPGSLPPARMEALRVWVEELGGGLLMLGGESVYGEDGYADTPVEELMPVWFEAERKPKDLALVIAMDKSYSMVGDNISMAKEASKAAVELLEEEQLFGLLAFDYHFYWPVPIQEAAGKARIRERIDTIEASSPTNIYPALQDVYTSLLPVDAEVKHVILLSDGKTYEDDYETLVTRMADSEITVSTVALGGKADRQLLADIATWGEGRAYVVEDASRVPEIFVDETQRAQGITLEESEPFRPVVAKPVELLAGLDMEAAPTLAGYVRTLPKDSAEVILETGQEDPLLVRWQYGLGRSVLFAADAKNRWAVEWLDWEGYGKFWAQLVRETMRQPEFRGPELEVLREGSRARVRLRAVDARGRFRNSLTPEVERLLPDGSSSIVPLAQVAPGTYEATAPIPREGDVAFRWLAPDDGLLARTLTPPPLREIRFRPTDEAVLRSIAEATGGLYDPEPGAIFDVDDRTVTRPTRLWPALTAVALLAYLLNMALRRVRVMGPGGLRARLRGGP